MSFICPACLYDDDPPLDRVEGIYENTIFLCVDLMKGSICFFLQVTSAFCALQR